MVAGGTTASAGGWHGREHQGCEDAVPGVPFWVSLSHRGAFPQLLALPLNNCSEDSWKSLQGPPGGNHRKRDSQPEERLHGPPHLWRNHESGFFGLEIS